MQLAALEGFEAVKACPCLKQSLRHQVWALREMKQVPCEGRAGKAALHGSKGVNSAPGSKPG